MAAAALMFGGAGYACRAARPAGTPRGLRRTRAHVPVTAARHALLGQFMPPTPGSILAEGFAARGKTADAVGLRPVRIAPTPTITRCGSASATPWSTMPHDDAGGALRLTPAPPAGAGLPAPRFFLGLAEARSGNREAALACGAMLATAPGQGQLAATGRGCVLAISAGLSRGPPRQAGS